MLDALAVAKVGSVGGKASRGGVSLHLLHLRLGCEHQWDDALAYHDREHPCSLGHEAVHGQMLSFDGAGTTPIPIK